MSSSSRNSKYVVNFFNKENDAKRNESIFLFLLIFRIQLN